MILLLTGSRFITSETAVAVYLHPLFRRGVLLVHGGGDGTDTVGDRLWKRWDGDTKPFPADWPHCIPACRPGHRRVNRRGQSYCPLAGFRRNQEQVDWVAARMAEQVRVRGLALLAAGQKSSGTRDCLRRARKAGIHMDDYTLEAA